MLMKVNVYANGCITPKLLSASPYGNVKIAIARLLCCPIVVNSQEHNKKAHWPLLWEAYSIHSSNIQYHEKESNVL
jgi:hypothetical protein